MLNPVTVISFSARTLKTLPPEALLSSKVVSRNLVDPGGSVGLDVGESLGAEVVGLVEGDFEGLDVGLFVGFAVVGDEVPSKAYSMFPFHIEASLYV